MCKAEHVYGSWSYNFISLQWTRACSSCLQVHLVALDLRMHLMSLLRNWDLATAAIKDQGSKSLNNLGGPHAAQRISIRTKCEKTKQYIRALAHPKESCSRRTEESSSVRPRSGWFFQELIFLYKFWSMLNFMPSSHYLETGSPTMNRWEKRGKSKQWIPTLGGGTLASVEKNHSFRYGNYEQDIVFYTFSYQIKCIVHGSNLQHWDRNSIGMKIWCFSVIFWSYRGLNHTKEISRTSCVFLAWSQAVWSTSKK